jgi:hypothetical protein
MYATNVAMTSSTSVITKTAEIVIEITDSIGARRERSPVCAKSPEITHPKRARLLVDTEAVPVAAGRPVQHSVNARPADDGYHPMLKLSNLVKVTLAIVCCWPMSASADQGKGGSKKNDRAAIVHHERDHHGRGNDDSYFKKNGHTKLHIPRGHYPPPGECRIWYPGRPPGHQPPPMTCAQARAEVAPGAWIIRHPAHDPEHVHVAVYDEGRPGSVLVVGQFKIATGVFVRVVVDR